VYEARHEPPVTRAAFTRRLVWHGVGVLALLLASLGGGMVGYVALEGLSPLDAFLNAAMLLGGMGPVDLPKTAAGKLFAGCYALYAGLVFIVSAALVFTPVLHRVLHRFHWDDGPDAPGDAQAAKSRSISRRRS
jgi:hypothetical protein